MNESKYDTVILSGVAMIEQKHEDAAFESFFLVFWISICISQE